MTSRTSSPQGAAPHGFDRYFGSHPDAVFVLGAALNVQAANDPARLLLDAAGSAVGGALPFADAASVFADAKENRVKRVLRRSGNGRLFELDIGPIEGDGVLVIARDITNFANLQSDLENRFQVMADSAPVMIWMSDTAELRDWFNRPWLEFRGRTTAQESGNGWKDGMHAEDSVRCLENYRRNFEARQSFSMDYRLLRKDGQYRWILDQGAPRYASNGTFTGYIGSCIDIHDRKELERQNAAQAQALALANRRKDEFVAMLAHELRTPLAPIETSAAILDRVKLADAAVANVSRVITRQVSHMRRLIDDLLDVSRIDRGKIALDLAPFALKDLVDAAVEATAGTRVEHGNALKVELEGETAVMGGDIVRLTQAVSNLLDNASKFSPDGAPVLLSVKVADGTLQIRVTDEGVGISDDFLPQAFDMFTQFEPGLSRTRGGLGIGLTVARAIARLHGGHLTARSAGVGLGSEFIFEIPAEIVPPVESGPLPVLTDGKCRILIVEDSDDAREALAELLRLMGHEVAEARSAQEALSRGPAFKPEVVMCDIGLPDKSGYHLVGELRAAIQPPPLVMAAVTGYAPQGKKVDGLQMGFDEYLVKPIRLSDLERLLLIAGGKRA